MSTDALIGCTGFVGGTLLRQRGFDARYHSTDIAEIRGRTFGTIVCAGAPAAKWIANRDPDRDREVIDGLIAHLDACRCERFVLVSTVDVFESPAGVDECTPVPPCSQAYGGNRRRLEEFVGRRFERHLVVRLPGLVGPGLRKNLIYDLHHGNVSGPIDARATYQFYPTVNLWSDIDACLRAELPLVHLTAEPVTMGDVASAAFGLELPPGQGPYPRYDMRSVHAEALGGRGHYQYSARESLLAIRAYVQSEPRKVPPA